MAHISIWNDADPIAEPTEEWQKLNLLHHNIEPLKNEDLFGEGNLIYDISLIIKKLIPISPRKSHSVDDWISVFSKAFDEETQLAQTSNGNKLRKFAIRMAVSNPRSLFEASVWEGHVLWSRHDTGIWSASYDIFGAPWNKLEESVSKKRAAKDQTPESEDSTTYELGTTTTNTANVTNTTTTNMTTTTTTNESPQTNTDSTTTNKSPATNTDNPKNPLEPPFKLFISRAPVKKATKIKLNLINPENKRKNTTFCKIKLPRITKESILEGSIELVASFNTMARRLIHLDSSMIILPWEDT